MDLACLFCYDIEIKTVFDTLTPALSRESAGEGAYGNKVGSFFGSFCSQKERAFFALTWQQNRRHGLRCDAFFASGEAQPFRRCRLHAHAADIDAEQVGDAGHHGGGVRGDFGLLADEGDIDIGEGAAAGGDAGGSMAEEAGAVGVFVFIVAGGEMAADIAFGERAVDGVAQGMDADIGVGMAGQTMGVGDLNAAQHQSPVRDQDMDIEAGADPGEHHGGENPFEPGEVGFVGQFDVVVVARDQGDGVAGGLEDGGVVGGTFRGAPVEIKQEREAEGLRGLGAEQTVPGHSAGDDAVGAAFECVGDWYGGDGAGMGDEGGDQAGEGAGWQKGAGGIVDQHDVRGVGGERFEPGADAGLAGGATGDGWQMGDAGEGGGDRGCVPHRLDQGRFPRQGDGGVGDNRLSGEQQELFRDFGAKAAASAGGHQNDGDFGSIVHPKAHADTTLAGQVCGRNGQSFFGSFCSQKERASLPFVV